MTDARKNLDRVSEVLWELLRSPNALDSNLEPANVVDGLYRIAQALDRVADSLEFVARAVADNGGNR